MHCELIHAVATCICTQATCAKHEAISQNAKLDLNWKSSNVLFYLSLEWAGLETNSLRVHKCDYRY